MQPMARIAIDGGALYLAASTPYERELMLEHIAQYARRHRQARLELDRHHWLITTPTASPAVVCQRCNEPPRWLAYTEGRRTLCQACAREDIKRCCELVQDSATARAASSTSSRYARRR